MSNIGFTLMLLIIYSSNLYSQKRYNLEEMREKLDSIEVESNFLISRHEFKNKGYNLFEKKRRNELLTLVYQLDDTLKFISLTDSNKVSNELIKYSKGSKHIEVNRFLSALEDSLMNIKASALQTYIQDTTIRFRSKSSIPGVVLRNNQNEVTVYVFEQSLDSHEICLGNNIVYYYNRLENPYLIKKLGGEQSLIQVSDDITMLYIVLKNSQIINSLDILALYTKLRKRKEFDDLKFLSRVNMLTYQYKLVDKKFSFWP